MGLLIWCISIFAGLIVVLFTYCQWRFNYWKRRGVETRQPQFLLGNVQTVFQQQETLAENIASIYNEFKSKGLKYCGYYFTLQPVWMVLDPDLIKLILTKDFDHFMDRGLYTNERNDPLTGQLFQQRGQKWKTLRSKLTPTYTSGKMKIMFPNVYHCSNELVTVIDNFAGKHTGVDIKTIASRYTIDIIGRCAFGLDCNTLHNPDSDFSFYGKKALDKTGVRFLKLLCLTSFPWVFDLFKIPLFPRDVAKFFNNIVKETIEYREENGVTGNDFMHLLMQLKNIDEEATEHTKNEIKLTTQEITAQVFVFFVAGYDSSSGTLTFCLYELASNQEFQSQVRNEIVEVSEKYGGHITYDALSEMTYMEMCIKETLRKYPVLPVLFRECTETFNVPGDTLLIEKGTNVFIPILGLHYNEEYFPSPHKFDPERFNRENNAKIQPYTWLPFGEGPRGCIGLRFAMMQIKVALANLLKQYIFTVNTRTNVPLIMDPHSFLTTTKGGVWLNIEKI